MKKHAVYLTVDELTSIIIAYDGSITLLKQNYRTTEFPHMKEMFADSIKREEEMSNKLIKIRNDLKANEENNDEPAFAINNEGEFNKLIRKLAEDGKITEEERRTMSDYVCGIFDALDGMYDIEEEDLM